MKRYFLPVAALFGATVLLSACSGSSGAAPALPPPAPAATTVAAAAPTATAATTAAGMGSYGAGQGQSGYLDGTVTLQVAKGGSLGKYVVDGQGFTLYRFDPDSSDPSKSTCNGACATTWPPTLAAHTVQFSKGIKRSDIGVVRRDDGTFQMTLGGHPVYRFSKDTGPEQTNGQGVGGTWFVVAPDGSKATVS